MYEHDITRRDPGCIIFLVDRSDSMKAPWGASGMTLAEGAARAINKVLLELCVKSIKEAGAPMRPYFYIGIYGYGYCPSNGGEGVESALPGDLGPRGIVPLVELAGRSLATREEPSVDAGAPSAKVPIWLEAYHGQRTPMCEAFALVGAHVMDWACTFNASFPPIVINLTDGMVTDAPYQGRGLADWASRLTSIRTDDGHALLLNIFLSPSRAQVVSFPASGSALPSPGPDLFSISSPLPEPMIKNARAANIDVPVGGRGLVFNADLSSLVSFLEIGTRVSVRDV